MSRDEINVNTFVSERSTDTKDCRDMWCTQTTRWPLGGDDVLHEQTEKVGVLVVPAQDASVSQGRPGVQISASHCAVSSPRHANRHTQSDGQTTNWDRRSRIKTADHNQVWVDSMQQWRDTKLLGIITVTNVYSQQSRHQLVIYCMGDWEEGKDRQRWWRAAAPKMLIMEGRSTLAVMCRGRLYHRCTNHRTDQCNSLPPDSLHHERTLMMCQWRVVVDTCVSLHNHNHSTVTIAHQ